MSEPFIGEIKYVGFTFAPRGYSNCDGQLLQISQYSALFSLLGTIYGGDGETTFGLPDLRGRVPMHVGHGPGLPTYRMGQRGGAVSHTLTTLEMPSHAHTVRVRCVDDDGGTNAAAGHAFANGPGAAQTYSTDAPDADMHANSIIENNVGGSREHNNLQPFLVVRAVIALQGIFPSPS